MHNIFYLKWYKVKCLTTKQPWWNFFHSKLFVFCRVANTLECCSNRVKKALAENAHWNGRRYFATQRKMGNHSFFILLLLFHVQCKTLKFIRIFLWIFSIIFQTCLLQAYIKTPSRIVYIYIDTCLRYSTKSFCFIYPQIKNISKNYFISQKYQQISKIYLKPLKT